MQESYKNININTTATAAANEIDDCSAHSLFSFNLFESVHVHSTQIREENNANSMLLVAQHVDDGEGGGGNTHKNR